MKKDECEKALRQLCHVWREECGQSSTPPLVLHFEDFYSWVQINYPSYLNFRTTTGVSYDVEMWFEQEFKTRWAH